MALSPGVDDGIVGDEVGTGIVIIFVVVGVMGVLVSFFETIEECLGAWCISATGVGVYDNVVGNDVGMQSSLELHGGEDVFGAFGQSGYGTDVKDCGVQCPEACNERGPPPSWLLRWQKGGQQTIWATMTLCCCREDANIQYTITIRIVRNVY